MRWIFPQLARMFRVAALPCSILAAADGAAQVTVNPGDTACVNTVITFISAEDNGGACGDFHHVWTIDPATGWSVVAGDEGSMNGEPGDHSVWTGTTSIDVVFDAPGNYLVEVTSGSDCGITMSSWPVCIEAPPDPSFTVPATGCTPVIFVPQDVSDDSGCGTIRNWDVGGLSYSCNGILAWYFGGGGSAGSFQPAIHITEPGVYNVQLQMTNSCGSFQHGQDISVNGPPVVEISMPVSICAGACIEPTAIIQDCGAPLLSMDWSFPGGSIADSDELVPGAICYTGTGTTSVSLTAVNSCGTSTAALDLNIGGVPSTPAVSTNSPVCAGHMISLTATVPPGATVSWTGPGGFTSAQAWVMIPNASAAHSGIYTAVITAAGCPSGSASVEVQVVAVPAVSITPQITTICAGEEVLLTAAGAGTYQWHAGGSLVHTGPTFTADPASTTVYAVTGGLNGCQASTTVTVHVNPLPVVDAGPPLLFCDQAIPVQLNGSPASGQWSGPNVAPGGIFTPEPGGLGVFPLTYVVTNLHGCTDSAHVDMTVEALTLIADAGADTSFCQGQLPVMLPEQPAGGTWSEAGPGGAFVPGTPGIHVLTYSYGTGTCFTNDQVMVTVHGLPALMVEEDFAMCIDEGQRQLVASPAGGIWEGDGVDASTGSFDPVPGAQEIVYSISDNITGCINSDTIDVMVEVPPITVFDHDSIACVGASFTPLNTTTGSTAATWDFGDGSVSQDQQPQHVFQEAGEYTITLVANTDAGCSDTYSSTVVVWDLPQASIILDVDSGCGPLSIQPFNASIGEELSFSWDLGGLAGSVLEQPEPVLLPGDAMAMTTYPITLEATNTCGTSTEVRTVVVMPSPTASISAPLDTYCSHAVIGFSNDSHGLPHQWYWDFGDGMISDSSDPVVEHSYVVEDQAATFTATLIVSNVCGSDTASVSLNVLPNEVTAAFTASTLSGCAPLAVTFTRQSIGDTLWHWDTGDGTTSDLNELAHVFNDPGAYVITLHGHGCGYDSSTVVIDVLPLPDATFSHTPGTICEGAPVDLMANSPQLQGHYWDLGDGTVSDMQNVQHIFNSPGDHLVGHHISSSNGCSEFHQMMLQVEAAPVAVFSIDATYGCTGVEIPFHDVSSGSTSAIWSFGDGASGFGHSPMHAYGTPGEFDVMLVAMNDAGCLDTSLVHTAITIHPPPVAAFTHQSSATMSGVIQFEDLSEGAANWMWDLAGTSSMERHPLWEFPIQGGEFLVCLYVANEFSCSDTVCHSIAIKGDALLFAPDAFTPDGDGRNDTFRAVLNGHDGWNFTLLIFDRWGRQVYMSDDPDQGWDGSSNGHILPSGVYVWQVELKQGGVARRFQGHVSLIR